MAEMKILTQAGLEYLVDKIDEQLETKVNIESGKGLSTNDYTTAEKEALAKVIQDVEGLVADGGQPNVIEVVKVNDTALTVTDKAVNIDLSGYALKSDIVNAMYWRGTVETVAALPNDAAVGDIYHVTATGGEHAWDGSAWQELGSILDLSAYSTTEQVNGLISTAIAPKADKTYVDEQLALKAVAANTYTKTEVDGLVSPLATTQALNDGLALKADKSTTYTKTETDNLLALKAVAADVYTKTEADGLLAGKSDNGHKHEIGDVNGLQSALDAKAVKTEVEAALALKANAADFVAITNAEIDALFTA